MTRMPNISLTEQDVHNLIDHNRFNYGGEAIICRNENPNTLYKIFVYPSTDTPKEMSKNKEIKVSLLHQLKLPNSTIPLSTISMDGRLVGYEMANAIGYHPLYIPYLTREATIEALKQSKKTLEYFASKDITYGDIKNDNLLINPTTGDIIFCDMDNVRIGTRPIDLTSYELEWFGLCYGRIDEKADAFMHNLLTLEMLNYRNITRFQYLLDLLRSGEEPLGYEEVAKKTLQSMLNPKNFDGEYIIQYVKK